MAVGSARWSEIHAYMKKKQRDDIDERYEIDCRMKMNVDNRNKERLSSMEHVHKVRFEKDYIEKKHKENREKKISYQASLDPPGIMEGP